MEQSTHVLQAGIGSNQCQMMGIADFCGWRFCAEQSIRNRLMRHSVRHAKSVSVTGGEHHSKLHNEGQGNGAQPTSHQPLSPKLILFPSILRALSYTVSSVLLLPTLHAALSRL